jgi:hypothetical protein
MISHYLSKFIAIYFYGIVLQLTVIPGGYSLNPLQNKWVLMTVEIFIPFVSTCPGFFLHMGIT